MIDFARVPEAKSVKNRLHLDLRSTDMAAANFFRMNANIPPTPPGRR